MFSVLGVSCLVGFGSHSSCLWSFLLLCLSWASGPDSSTENSWCSYLQKLRALLYSSCDVNEVCLVLVPLSIGKYTLHAYLRVVYVFMKRIVVYCTIPEQVNCPLASALRQSPVNCFDTETLRVAVEFSLFYHTYCSLFLM